jgi:hypothetical protein
MSSDKRVMQHGRSTVALAKLLGEAIGSPAEHLQVPGLAAALKSQGALANFGAAGSGVTSSSLNTIKRIANEVLDGGFDGLDRLRRAALDALTMASTKATHSNKVDKAGLTLRVEELEADNQSLRQDLLLLTFVLEKALRQAKNYAAKGDSASQTLCRREQRELLDMLSLRRSPSTGKLQI